MSNENDKYKRASLKGRGWQILTGKSIPEAGTDNAESEEILGQVDISADEAEALLDIAPPALGIRETSETDLVDDGDSDDIGQQFTQMLGGAPTISPDTLAPVPENPEDNKVGEVLQNISTAMLRQIGGSSLTIVPDFAQHPIDEDSLLSAQEKAAYHLARPRTEGEVLNPPMPTKAKRATHEALPVIEARRATQTIDLAQAKLNRRELDDITPNQPEIFG